MRTTGCRLWVVFFAGVLLTVPTPFRIAALSSEETASIDPDGDGIELADDNCPVLQSLLLNDQDGDGVGDQCDRWSSSQPPRALLVQAIALAGNAGVALPACASASIETDAWVTDYHLTDNPGPAAFRCAVSIYRRLAQVNGNVLATQARSLAAQALASMGEEAVAAILALGIDPSGPAMVRATALADGGVGKLAVDDPKGAKDLKRARKLAEIADKRERTIGDFSKALVAGDFRVKTHTVTQSTWTGCWATVYFRPKDPNLECDAIAYLQANRITDSAGNVVSAADQAAGDSRRSKAGWKIDRVDGFNSPCFGIKDDGTADTTKTKKGTTNPQIPAELYDGPCVPDATTYCFETCAVCKSGAAANRILGCTQWGCMLNAAGTMVMKDDAANDVPSGAFSDAVEAWNEAVGKTGNPNHGRNPIPALTPWKK